MCIYIYIYIYISGGWSPRGPYRDKYWGHFSLGALLCFIEYGWLCLIVSLFGTRWFFTAWRRRVRQRWTVLSDPIPAALEIPPSAGSSSGFRGAFQQGNLQGFRTSPLELLRTRMDMLNIRSNERSVKGLSHVFNCTGVWTKTSPEKKTCERVRSQNTESGAGEQFLPQDFRAQPAIQGVGFVTDTDVVEQQRLRAGRTRPTSASGRVGAANFDEQGSACLLRTCWH